MDLIAILLLIILLAAVFGGFAIHWLWIIILVVLILWLVDVGRPWGPRRRL
jgi:hypothetical protein